MNIHNTYQFMNRGTYPAKNIKNLLHNFTKNDKKAESLLCNPKCWFKVEVAQAAKDGNERDR